MGANDFIRWRELYDRLATRRPGINPALNGFTEEDPVLEGVEGTIAPTVQIGVDLTAWLRNEGNRIAFFAAQTVVGATQYIELFVNSTYRHSVLYHAWAQATAGNAPFTLAIRTGGGTGSLIPLGNVFDVVPLHALGGAADPIATGRKTYTDIHIPAGGSFGVVFEGGSVATTVRVPVVFGEQKTMQERGDT